MAPFCSLTQAADQRSVNSALTTTNQMSRELTVFFQQSEVEPYLDKNIWNTLASNIPVDSMGYSKDMLPDSRDIINFVEGSQSILIDTREGIHGELVGSKDEALHLRNPGSTLVFLH